MAAKLILLTVIGLAGTALATSYEKRFNPDHITGVRDDDTGVSTTIVTYNEGGMVPTEYHVDEAASEIGTLANASTSAVVESVEATVTGAGTTSADAEPLSTTDTIHPIDGASNSGVIFGAAIPVGTRQTIINVGANTVKIYPYAGNTNDGASTAISLATGKSIELIGVTSTAARTLKGA